MDDALFVGFSRSNGLVARLIRWFTKGQCNHSFLTWTDEHLGKVVLGANSNGISLDTWENFTAKREVLIVFCPKKGLRPLWMGLCQLRDEINAGYDTPALVGMSVVEVARHLFGKEVANPFDRNTAEMFCSEFTTRVIRASGYLLLVDQPANTVDPQEEMEALLDHPAFTGWRDVVSVGASAPR